MLFRHEGTKRSKRTKKTFRRFFVIFDSFVPFVFQKSICALNLAKRDC